MPLKHVYRKKFKGVTLRSGHFYRFKYLAWQNDPRPVVIFMSSIEGNHQNTGHQWRIFQCINFTYIPRAHRKRFMKIWMNELDKTKNIKFTWQKVIAKYPYLKPAIRRYFFKPNYYITKLEEIPLDEAEKAVISTFTKDFSKKIKTAILGKFRKAFSFKKKAKKTKKKKRKR